ncbi:MAG TPA: acyl-CoA dehydrogenase family protein [Jatrophihabitantaceae bacterium]|jgi:hypothetical protein
MNPDELEMLRGWATGLLSAGRGANLVDELEESEFGSEVLASPQVAGMLFELHGSLCAVSPLLDRYVLRTAGHVVLGLSGRAAARLDGDQVVLDGVAFGSDSSFVVGLDDGTSGVLTSLSVSLLGLPPAAGFDPASGLVRLQCRVAVDDVETIDVAADVLTARAARAIAHQLVGVAEAARTVAVRHVQERHQFGRPIGAFQSVRHRLADALIAETGARELLALAGEPADPVVERLVLKATAGRAALLSVQAAQQVCGAMGFTEEFGLHRLVRRAYVLDALLGSSEDAEDDLAVEALARGVAPLVSIGL